MAAQRTMTFGLFVGIVDFFRIIWPKQAAKNHFRFRGSRREGDCPEP